MTAEDLKRPKWWIIQSFHWILGGVFLYAGLLKVLDPGLFLINLRGYHLFPDPFAAWIALFLPWVEVLAGAAVVTGFFHRGGLWIVNFLLAAFCVVIVISFARGLDVDCGCFGGVKAGNTMVTTLIRDVVMLGMGLWLSWQKRF